MTTDKPKLTVEQIEGFERYAANDLSDFPPSAGELRALCHYARIGLAAERFATKELGVATFKPGECWCLKNGDEIVGTCSQCPIHGEEKP